MTEKIEWYKEVLELEPNSKVFFPLARLLTEEQRFDEAVDVLEQGLARHSEFLEARLFFIELLFKTGRQEACSAQISKLSKMFSEYTGFWQAWAACLASSDDTPDTAAVLRFLALNFMRGPISLHEVLNQGVASLLVQDGPRTETAQDAPACGASENVSMSTPPAFEEPEAPESEQSRSASSGQEPGHIERTHETEPAPLAVLSDAEELSLPLLPEEEDMTFPQRPLPGDSYEEELSSGGDEMSFDPDAAMSDDEALPEDPDLEHILPRSTAQEGSAVQPQAGGVAESPFPAVDETEDGEERFSLRTRSMAEVLAEQGDIKGALDIYHELAAAAVGPEESADLRQRIATLSARLGSAQETEQEQASAQPESSSGKDKLISMLEALAERVEARAQS